MRDPLWERVGRVGKGGQGEMGGCSLPNNQLARSLCRWVRQATTNQEFAITMTKDCWNQIGTMGDRSCPELETFIHCHNCPVYSTAGRRLLEREAPPGYRDEWTNLLAKEESNSDRSENLETGNTFSVVIFRLGVEWFALSAKLVREVIPPTTIHTVPHRSNQIFLGLANVGGELLLCISLSSLLGLEITAPRIARSVSKISGIPVVYRRTIAIEKAGNSWLFETNEIYGIYRVSPEQFSNVPAVNSQASKAYTQAIIKLADRSVNLLDDELLFYTLERRIL